MTTHAILGFGPVGQALANMFARKGLEVMVASRRPPEALLAQAAAIGPTIRSAALSDASRADVVLLAVPFAEVAKLASVADWHGRIVIDVTNAYGVPVEELGGLPSSAVNAKTLVGARLVKAWNHLPAAKLAADPDIGGGRRVVFVSSDDETAAEAAAGLAEQLGYAPVQLGGLAAGGLLVQARGREWAPLIFQDLFKPAA